VTFQAFHDCSWEYGTNFENRTEFYYHWCISSFDNGQVSITCLYEEGVKTSHLTLTQPTIKGDLNIRVRCDGDRQALPTISIQGNGMKKFMKSLKILVILTIFLKMYYCHSVMLLLFYPHLLYDIPLWGSAY